VGGQKKETWKGDDNGRQRNAPSCLAACTRKRSLFEGRLGNPTSHPGEGFRVRARKKWEKKKEAEERRTSCPGAVMGTTGDKEGKQAEHPGAKKVGFVPKRKGLSRTSQNQDETKMEETATRVLRNRPWGTIKRRERVVRPLGPNTSKDKNTTREEKKEKIRSKKKGTGSHEFLSKGKHLPEPFWKVAGQKKPVHQIK